MFVLVVSTVAGHGYLGACGDFGWSRLSVVVAIVVDRECTRLIMADCAGDANRGKS